MMSSFVKLKLNTENDFSIIAFIITFASSVLPGLWIEMNFYYCRLRLQPFTETSVWISQGAFGLPAFLLYYAWQYSSNSSLVMSSYI